MSNRELAEFLFPNVKVTPEDQEKKYPPRKLPEGAKVTRLGPSPTGLFIWEIFTGLLPTSVSRISPEAFSS